MDYRPLSKGMGEAVAKRTILRTINGELETWGDVASRVAEGNALIIKNNTKMRGAVMNGMNDTHYKEEKENLRHHIAKATLLMSGRHLQHGDETQHTRNMEVFTNCSTSTTSFALFYLLLNGSGVGRAYDTDMCLVDWDNMPNVQVVLDESHKDFEWGKDQSVKEAKAKYKGENTIWFEVPDTREGWAGAIEKLEVMAFEGTHKDKILVLDFSKVRASGEPINGMQKRPASGPKPLMKAIQNVYSIKGAGMTPWKQAMWIDHYLAECVLVGGARRSARMSTKSWRDKDVFDFIQIKRGGLLWSSNNSVTVDEEFWKQDDIHAQLVLKSVTEASYHDGTGEPGFINQDKLKQVDQGMEEFIGKKYVGSEKYVVKDETQPLLDKMVKAVLAKKYTQITNPCGEITLNMLGGYCVIADVVPYHADTLEEAEDAFRVATRALIRVNTLDSLYHYEVERTNRIGVGITGLHEFAWKFFGYNFEDLIDEEKSQDFWDTLARFRDAVVDEANKYSDFIGVTRPHSYTTMKPAGTTSKLFGLSEGAHLPSMKEFMRWVQFREDDPLVKTYKDLGYPIKVLKAYHGTVAIGFPTQPEICRIGMGDKLMTAGEATPEQQYKYLMLLEKYYMGEDGNQISYTLKYNPEKVSYEEFTDMMIKYQSQIRCCSVMPQVDTTAYEYQPEEPISGTEFIKAVGRIKDSSMTEDIDLEHLRCESGACPI